MQRLGFIIHAAKRALKAHPLETQKLHIIIDLVWYAMGVASGNTRRKSRPYCGKTAAKSGFKALGHVPLAHTRGATTPDWSLHGVAALLVSSRGFRNLPEAAMDLFRLIIPFLKGGFCGLAVNSI